jgi:DNA invertase Pin-like site-specific DNA recombinase
MAERCAVPAPVEPPTPIRCAIYTRKSTEEGLEQAFNSLHAQRESAEAYIQSQKHLGWTVVQTAFDDGGFSGGSLDRPALQQLLEQIDARQIDCVVVYKVDRLSRSLFDFARLMERFDQRSISFVSVTQQFNTTPSLGRLTLNILLSFAQFERELIGERTRDKMSAARRKGKWVGGTPMLGYDIDPAGGRLVMNRAEAERIREIFALYHRHRSLAVVVAELQARGWANKSWKSRRGIHHIGKPFSTVSLRMLLSNATYQGKVRYHGVIYPGEHPAIIDESLWNEVNLDFQNPIEKQKQQPHQSQNAPLAGLLFCDACQVPMIATYSTQGKRRYRYYVCQTAKQKGWKSCPTKSVSASLLESSLLIEFRSKLESAEVRQRLHIPDSDWHALVRADSEFIERVLPKIEQVRYDGPSGVVSVQLRNTVWVGADNESAFEYKIPRRRGRTLPSFRMRPASETLTRPPRLARLVALAHKLEALVRSGKVKDFAELARLARISSARIGQIVILAQLAPAIQEHILFLPTEQAIILGERQLREIACLPRWDHQQALFERLLGTSVTEPI